MCGPCGPTGRMTQWTAVSFPALIRYCNPRLTPVNRSLWRREETRATLNPSATEGPTQAHPGTSNQCTFWVKAWLKDFSYYRNIFLLVLIWLNCPFATVNAPFKAPRSRSLFYYGLFKAGDPACGSGTNQSSLVQANASSRWYDSQVG